MGMDVSISVKRFLQNRRDRVVGSILGHIETELRPRLTKDQWDAIWPALRQAVLSATNSYHDTVLDLLKAEDVSRNDHLIDLLERVDSKLTNAQRSASRPVPHI